MQRPDWPPSRLPGTSAPSKSCSISVSPPLIRRVRPSPFRSGTVAFRNPAIVRHALAARGTGAQDSSSVPEKELMLLRDAFDLLDEDFAEERFYVLMRGDYWTSPEGSGNQSVAEAAIRILEF